VTHLVVGRHLGAVNEASPLMMSMGAVGGSPKVDSAEEGESAKIEKLAMKALRAIS